MSLTWGPDHMGPAQGAVLAHQIRGLVGEVKHREAAHPEHDDDLVITMREALRDAQRAADLLVALRSAPSRCPAHGEGCASARRPPAGDRDRRRQMESDTTDDMRANLTDELYQQMIANPDMRLPFLVYWPRVARELTPA